VIAAGGVVGALGRFGLAVLIPGAAAEFPWATFWTNITGCLLIGALMVLSAEVWSAHQLLRPFLGTGVLGGYTTFSAYTVETLALFDAGQIAQAFGYLASTLIGGMLAVWAGAVLTRSAISSSRLRSRQEAAR
jgi:CrcB protein